MIRPSALLLVLLGLAAMGVNGAAQGPASNACGLLTADEVQTLAPKEQHPSSGLPNDAPSVNLATCRYTWGEGTGRYALVVSLNPAARVFAGMSAEAIRQNFASTIVPETADAKITDVGDTAMFKAPSSGYATASAYVKDRVLQITLDGMDAREKKGELIALLKAAASRL